MATGEQEAAGRFMRADVWQAAAQVDVDVTRVLWSRGEPTGPELGSLPYGRPEKQELKPWARLVSHAVAAVEPGMFGIGPLPAVKLALEHAGWKHADIERIEINEAFAAITLACLRELALPLSASCSTR